MTNPTSIGFLGLGHMGARVTESWAGVEVRRERKA